MSQRLLEALPSGALIVDGQGRIAAVNLQAEIIFGWVAPMLEGRPVHEILRCRQDDPSNPNEDCPVAHVLRGENPAANDMMWIRCRDDSFKLIEYRCGPYPGENGPGAILTFRDLSRQRELEEDLRRLGSIAEESPIAIVELNEDGNLLYANAAMMRLVQRFGFSSHARPSILPAKIENLIAKCLQSQCGADEIEVSVGSNHYVWKLTPVLSARLVRGYGIDITARKQAEIGLRHAMAKAEAANRVKSKFLGHMSTTLCTPIRDILNKSARLTASDLKDEDRECANSIQVSAKSLMGMIGQILDMAVLQAGKFMSETHSFDIRTFMNDAVAPFVGRAEEKGLRLKLTLADGIPVKVCCDSKKLGQLLYHLLTNAINFTDQGEVAVAVDRDTLTVHAVEGRGNGEGICSRGQASHLFFTVHDTGIGIPSERHKEIFDGFGQDNGAGWRRCRGSGVGLAISKQLVDLMGGTIGVESEPGKGSQFWFSLPIQLEEQKAE